MLAVASAKPGERLAVEYAISQRHTANKEASEEEGFTVGGFSVDRWLTSPPKHVEGVVRDVAQP